ncbi:MAG: RNA-binding S4 domain-containing protein [Planctomycetaceae bacterium]
MRTDLEESNQMTAAHSKPALCLDQFLKLNSIAESGGHAKVMIQGGEVKLNGQVETRRRKKLAVGDVIEVSGGKWVVENVAG